MLNGDSKQLGLDPHQIDMGDLCQTSKEIKQMLDQRVFEIWKRRRDAAKWLLEHGNPIDPAEENEFGLAEEFFAKKFQDAEIRAENPVSINDTAKILKLV